MVIGYLGFGKGGYCNPLFEAINTFQKKNDPKKKMMPFYDIRGQLYENTIYETFDYTITRYKRNSVYGKIYTATPN